MKDEGESLQGVRSGQAPRRHKGRTKMGLLHDVQESGGSGNSGVVDQAVLGFQGESVYCPMSESKESVEASSCDSLASSRREKSINSYLSKEA